jgi:hypothetical protein
MWSKRTSEVTNLFVFVVVGVLCVYRSVFACARALAERRRWHATAGEDAAATRPLSQAARQKQNALVAQLGLNVAVWGEQAEDQALKRVGCERGLHLMSEEGGLFCFMRDAANE